VPFVARAPARARSAWLAFTLTVAAALAGCAGEADPASGPREGVQSAVATRPDGTQPPPSLDKPAWALGDAWTYSVDGSETTYVITAETATDWLMETDSAERAFAEQREDISRLGPQRKSDLAGSQGADRVEFFRWPLTDGASWSTRWDGQTVTIAASVGVMGDAGLTATDEAGNVVYRYSYQEATRWFTQLDRYAPDGTQEVSLRLTKAVRNWTGNVAQWSLQPIIEGSGPAGVSPPVVGGPFEVAAGTTDLWAEYHFTCTGTGGFSVVVEPINPGLAANQGMQDSGPCVQVDWEGAFVEGPHPGTWAFAITAGGETVAYDYALLARTRLEVAFPPA
jgi:hypothetical protein